MHGAYVVTGSSKAAWACCCLEEEKFYAIAMRLLFLMATAMHVVYVVSCCCFFCGLCMAHGNTCFATHASHGIHAKAHGLSSRLSQTASTAQQKVLLPAAYHAIVKMNSQNPTLWFAMSPARSYAQLNGCHAQECLEAIICWPCMPVPVMSMHT